VRLDAEMLLANLVELNRCVGGERRFKVSSRAILRHGGSVDRQVSSGGCGVPEHSKHGSSVGRCASE